jgi:hypothetical protein
MLIMLISIAFVNVGFKLIAFFMALGVGETELLVLRQILITDRYLLCAKGLVKYTLVVTNKLLHHLISSFHILQSILLILLEI